MPETPRMSLPYPNKDDTDWFDQVEILFRTIDAHMYAHREDRNTVMYSSATWTWDAPSDTLTWDAPFYITGAQTGGRWKVDAGSLSIEDGYMMVVAIPRYPQSEDVVTDVQARAACEQNDEGFVVCVRKGSDLYFRTGVLVTTGSSVNIFNVFGGGAPGGNVEEHQQHMHDNGIVRSITSAGALALSVTDGGGAADDTLDVAAIPGGDYAYVDGKQRTEPSAPFSYTNPAIAAGQVRLYRALLPDSGDPTLQQRASYTQPAALDNFFIVNCSRGITPGARNLVFTTVVAANFWKVEFDGGKPFLSVGAIPLQTGVYRLYSQDGVNWIDVFFDSSFDWTKVDIGSPHTVAVTFASEVDEDANLLLGSAVEWESGGWAQWGYDTTNELVDQRYFGNLGADSIRDDLLQSIAERAWIEGINGVVFDRKAGWTGDIGVGLNPMVQWPEHNFGLSYTPGTIVVQGGKILLDGEVVEIPTTNFNVNLATPGVDYYLWYDKSTQSLQITEQSTFPTVGGVANPLAWIIGGSIGLPDYVASDLDKPSRGVPLYVFQRGAANNQINEGTLCDLRRNVTKAALKNHVSVTFRPDWQTPSFLALSNVPDINESEGEFGCLDAAFRYMNAVPSEPGNGEWGGGSIYHRGRVVQVVQYAEERRALNVPVDTELRGYGFAKVLFHPSATPDTSMGWPFGYMLGLPDSSSIKDLLIDADGENGVRAAVGLIGEITPSQFQQGFYPRAVIENCTVYSTGQCALVGMSLRGVEKGLEALLYRSAFYVQNPHSHVTDGYGAYFETLRNVTAEDCGFIGPEYGFFVSTAFGAEGKNLKLDRCSIVATYEGGPLGATWPLGYAVYVPQVNDVLLQNCWIGTQHAHAVLLGGFGKPDLRGVLDGCIIQGFGDLTGSAANKQYFVEVNCGKALVHDCDVYGPITSNTESQLQLVRVIGGEQTDVSRTFMGLHVVADTAAWDYILYVDGGGSPTEILKNVVDSVKQITGGLTTGVYVTGNKSLKMEMVHVEDAVGIGIDVDPQIPDVSVSKCSVLGGTDGNGIRARGVIQGNYVANLKSWGIHCYPNSRVVDNEVYNVNHSSARPEGTGVYGETTAWGIRYGTETPFDTLIYGIHIKDNRISKVLAQVETPVNGNRDLLCGIGPEKEIASPMTISMEDCDISDNHVRDVTAIGISANTEAYGICLKHPRRSVRCDQNEVLVVGSEDQIGWSYGIGVIQGAGVLTADIYDVSICHNEVDLVTAIYISVGIHAGSGHRISVNDNDVTSCYMSQAAGLFSGYISYQDAAGLGGDEEQISICKNQMGAGQAAPSPGYVTTFGIIVSQTNPAVPVGQLEVNENQLDDDLMDGASGFITIQTDGHQITAKKNQHSFTDAAIPDAGVTVIPFNSGPRNVDVSQNEATGEYVDAFVHVELASVVTVADNHQDGFESAIAYGDGIFVSICSQIDVHDNIIKSSYPTPGQALVRIADCVFGDVHDNVLNGSVNVAAAGLDSLKFDGSGPGPTCYDLHVHDNKIYPRADGAATWDINFAGAAAAYGTNMTVWANVFGADGPIVGAQNFSGTPFYIAAPAPNNWDGAIFW